VKKREETSDDYEIMIRVREKVMGRYKYKRKKKRERREGTTKR
jgi:hypothetical protein